MVLDRKKWREIRIASDQGPRMFSRVRLWRWEPKLATTIALELSTGGSGPEGEIQVLRIGQLIIVGGPACAGKSFLIRKLQHGECPRLREQLGIDLPSAWLYVVVMQLRKLRQPVVERLLLHYDFYAQYEQDHGFRYILELIDNSDSTTILTLHAPPSMLIQRLDSRLLRSATLFFTLRLRRRKHLRAMGEKFRLAWEQRRAYKRGYSTHLYKEWFDAISRIDISAHWVIDFNDSDVLIAHPYVADEADQGSNRPGAKASRTFPGS